jgi:hypothetical protein
MEEPVLLKVWKFVPLDYFKLRTSKHLMTILEPLTYAGQIAELGIIRDN